MTAVFDPVASAEAIARVVLPLGRSFVGPLALEDAITAAEAERAELERSLVATGRHVVREAAAFGLDPINLEWACARQAMASIHEMDSDVCATPGLWAAVKRMCLRADELETRRAERMRLAMAPVTRELTEVLEACDHADAVLDNLRVSRMRWRRSVVRERKAALAAAAVVPLPVSPKRRHNEMRV